MSRGLTAFACAVGLLTGGLASADWDIFLDLERAVPSFRIEEYQPDIRWSGRINTIAVHPTDPSHITVASESGGLFQSRDGGDTWRHLDGMPAWRTVSVAYYGADPQILIATALSDFKTTSGGGVWRSTDGGETWAKAYISTVNGSCRQNADAWEITVSQTGSIVFVATECGIAVADGTWNWRRASSGDAGRPFRTVKDIGNRDLVAAGPEGVFYSTDWGLSWTRAVGTMGSVSSYHGLAVSPLDSSDLYLIRDRRGVTDNTSVNEVYYSFDRGRSWVRGPSPPEGSNGCGGVPFIRAGRAGSRTQLFAGNRCQLYRIRGAASSHIVSDHADARDLALIADEPAYLASDGGFHVWDEAGSAFVSEGGNGRGLSALQLYEVTGQQIEGGSLLGWPPHIERRRYDLYIGTQDNDLWSSANSGRTWPFFRHWEGFRIDLPRSVRTESQSRVVFTACGACGTGLSATHFRGAIEFPDATRAPDKPYAMLREGAFAQYGRIGPRGLRGPWGLHLTEDYGDRWRIVDVFPEDPASLPQFSGAPAMAYFALRTGVDTLGRAVDTLVRVPSLLGGGPSPECDDDGETSVFRRCYPDMAGHGGLGRRQHGFVGESVFAVDPSDPMHLIAPDPRDEHIKESWDGGKSWLPIEGARELVTRGGTLKSVAGDTWESLVSVVSFHPEHASLVLMGSREGGIHFSHDRGRHWQHVPGSERIVNVTSFHWKSHNEVLVSSYGRGLWRLRIAYTAPVKLFGLACGERCFLADLVNPLPVPFDGTVDFDGAVLTYSGGVMDAQADSGRLQGIAVTPGTTWQVATPDGKSFTSPADLLAMSAQGENGRKDSVTESSDPGDFKGLEPALMLMKQGWLIRGFTLVDGKVKHVVVADAEPRVKGPGSMVPFKNTGKTASGAEKRAYVTAEYDASHGRLTVVGERFQPGLTVALLLDGQPAEDVEPHQDGSFTVKLRPGLAQGPHTIRAVQRGAGVVLSDSTDVLVPSADGTAKGKTDGEPDEDEDEGGR